MALSEQQLGAWAQGPSQTEEESMQATVRAIATALASRFRSRLTVFAQGSYRNRTNVRRESDVDIVALDPIQQFNDFRETTDSAERAVRATFGPVDWTFADFKTMVYEALVARFGSSRVVRRDKCIHVRETASHINADVVPAFRRIKYGASGEELVKGIGFLTDSVTFCWSYPEQHYDNGTRKNDGVGRRYKRTVRILKHVRNALGTAPGAASNTPSFFIECLLYNAPDDLFRVPTYRELLSGVMSHLHGALGQDGATDTFMEVNGIKFLLRGPHTAAGGRRFLEQAWGHIAL